ncbi:MAG: hypothetical protein GY800_04675, partial [Planctomycetes bacterium]|nr:hypothetical protein [Planctomycetota bacterium]
MHLIGKVGQHDVDDMKVIVSAGEQDKFILLDGFTDRKVHPFRSTYLVFEKDGESPRYHCVEFEIMTDALANRTGNIPRFHPKPTCVISLFKGSRALLHNMSERQRTLGPPPGFKLFPRIIKKTNDDERAAIPKEAGAPRPADPRAVDVEETGVPPPADPKGKSDGKSSTTTTTKNDDDGSKT